MSVLYIAAAFDGSTTLDRKQGLIAAGWEIHHMDSDPWVNHRIRKWKGLHDRLSTGPLIWSFNRNILNEALKLRPQIVWIDKGIWVQPKTIKALRKMGAFVVHFTPDSAIQFNRTRCFINSIPQYDLLFTTKSWEMEAYHALGARRLGFAYQGTDRSRTRPMELSVAEQETFGCDVVFIGRGEDHYAKTLSEIVELIPTIKLKIWGAWEKAVTRFPQLKEYWQGRRAMGDEYARAISGAKIGLGMLSKLFPETETTRTFEIPACGTMLLAERTESHQALFEEGVEAEFYASPEEAADKIRNYLEDESNCKALAVAGYQRFIKSDYTTDRFMCDCVTEVERNLENANRS